MVVFWYVGVVCVGFVCGVGCGVLGCVVLCFC